MKRRQLLHMIVVLFLISCGNQNTENKKQKLSPNELYKRKVEATCTIITDMGQGSGFFIDSNIIVTNYHVIANAKTATVVLNNEAQKYEILGYLAVDKINDVALLLVNYKSQNILEIENDIPNPGDRVFSISTPIGLSKTFSDGLISGKKNFDGRTLIQITVPISHGSSGCPIMNEYGDVVGIAVGGIEEGNNLNFCIPTSYLLNLLEFKESYPTALNTNAKQEMSAQIDKPKSNQIPKSQNSEITKPKTRSVESRKSGKQETKQQSFTGEENAAAAEAAAQQQPQQPKPVQPKPTPTYPPNVVTSKPSNKLTPEQKAAILKMRGAKK